MTDTQQPAQGQQAGIQIVSQYIRDLSFENPNAPESLVGGWGPPETGVNITLQQRQLNDTTFEAVMNLKVEAKKKGDASKTAFIVELSYGALVVLQNVPAEHIQPVMMIEIPKQIFPFAREVIADATAKGGYPPLYLAPISFETLYVNEMKRQQTAGAA